MAMAAPNWQRRDDLFIVPKGGWLLVAVLLLAVALAGGRPLWAQGIVTLGIGLLWMIWPPEKSPGKPVIVVLLLLAAAPLASYLPQAFFAAPEWRSKLEELPAITGSWFVTPQPWLTFHVWLLWLAGLALAGWCATRSWDQYNRDTVARMFAAGLLGITVYALYAWTNESGPALWVSTDGFGPFANRNQWGSVLGLGGMLSLALIHQSVRHGSRRSVVLWSVALAVFIWSVIANGSRGGLVVLVTGCIAYWMFFGLARKDYRYAAIGLSLLFIFFSLFAYGGGLLLERFVGLREVFEGGTEKELRLEFYRMTANMLAASPLAGFGLGNFEYVFPFYLDYQPIFDRRPAHPESTVLWLASEGGWLLVVSLLVAFSVVFWSGITAKRLRPTSLRAAGLAGALVLVVNAFYEVSGHRIGSLFPALFIASLCLPSAAGAAPGPWLTTAFRAGGALLAVIGGLWLASPLAQPILPAVQGTLPLKNLATVQAERGEKTAAIETLLQAEKMSPLDWSAHWSLATLLLEEKVQDDAWREFRAVAALLPYMDWIIEREGYFWIPLNAGKAAYAWSEAMRRATHKRRLDMYAGFLRASAKAPNKTLSVLVSSLYPEDPEIEFIRIKAAGPKGNLRVPRLLESTGNLADAPDHLIGPLLRYMLDNGMGAEVESLADQQVRIKRLGWFTLAEKAAREGNLAEAVELRLQYGPRPALPAPISRSDLRSIERAAALAPMDIATAIAYYQALSSARRDDEAFRQLRRIMDSPNAPAYIWYLAARSAHERGRHDEAWEYLRTHEKKSAR